ncbi:MAG: AraC family transcriptional regulator [Cyclobacteriaceae bacterium]
MKKQLEEYPNSYLYRRIVQTKLFIDSHFAEKIDLNDISDEALFSKFHFIRLFKKIYERTPHQYLIKIRIEKAQELLSQNNSVTNVCFQVGFESLSSFTGLFKRIVKLTPSVYQKQFQERQRHIKESPLHFIPNCWAENKGWTKNSNFQEV